MTRIETVASIARRRCLRAITAAVLGGANLMLAAVASQAQAQIRKRHVVSLEIRKGKLTASEKTLRIVEGADVRIIWTTDKTAALHLHGYDIQVFASPGRIAMMSFRADMAGRFPISAHDLHHGALIYLEIYPR